MLHASQQRLPVKVSQVNLTDRSEFIQCNFRKAGAFGDEDSIGHVVTQRSETRESARDSGQVPKFQQQLLREEQIKRCINVERSFFGH